MKEQNEKQAIEAMARDLCACYVDHTSTFDPKATAEKMTAKGYRKQSEVIDEFAKKLKEYPIDVRLPLLGLTTKEEIEAYVNKLFNQVESIIDKIAEEMKGGAE